jgi:glycosyltransferase involved in cell wall biosynthesis
MSLYYKEIGIHLEECLHSLEIQTVPIYEIVIVEDGPLTSDLYEILSFWEKKLPIKRVILKMNMGLGMALNYGLNFCSYSLIARMDTDDICSPQRFEKQLNVFENNDIDICGSWISEFENNYKSITSHRILPECHVDIVKLSKLKNPLNHPSVMYRKSSVLSVDGYDDVLFFEDYHLWLKMIHSGCKFYNIQEPLVLMRAGIGQLSRRGGFNYARFELAFLKRCSKEKLISKRLALRNSIIRMPLRILPKKVLGKVYKILRTKDI